MNIQNITVNNGFVPAETNFISSDAINNAEIEFFNGTARQIGEQQNNFVDSCLSSAINSLVNIEEAGNEAEKNHNVVSTIDLTNPNVSKTKKMLRQSETKTLTSPI